MSKLKKIKCHEQKNSRESERYKENPRGQMKQKEKFLVLC